MLCKYDTGHSPLRDTYDYSTAVPNTSAYLEPGCPLSKPNRKIQSERIFLANPAASIEVAPDIRLLAC